MVYVESWDEFFEASQRLYSSDPVNTRFVMKYRHCDGKLVLKVTDNHICIKYRTDQLQDIKRVEKLNNYFLQAMSARKQEAGRVEGSDSLATPAPSGSHTPPASPARGKSKR